MPIPLPAPQKPALPKNWGTYSPGEQPKRPKTVAEEMAELSRQAGELAKTLREELLPAAERLGEIMREIVNKIEGNGKQV